MGPSERRDDGGLGVVGWIRYADDLVLATDAPGGGAALVEWLAARCEDGGLRLATRKTRVRSPGIERLEPFVLLGHPMRFAPSDQGWSLQEVHRQ